MAVLVTGASGFIGGRLSHRLCDSGEEIIGLFRSSSLRGASHDLVNAKYLDSFDGATDWSGYLKGVSCIVHCAAVAHGKAGDVWAVNVEGTLRLAHEAAAAGVRRFVFLSSIGVNGYKNNFPFTEIDPPNPADLYARSKWEAEQGLWSLKKNTEMEIVIIRPPLVYGPDAPGNFGALVRIIELGIPLPFGATDNERTLIALDNLVDLLIECIRHPSAANQMFLAGDGQSISTTGLLRSIAHQIGRPVRLIPFPSPLLMFCATLLGRRKTADRLLGSLRVDISKARDTLNWHPPLTVEEGLQRCFAERGGNDTIF